MWVLVSRQTYLPTLSPPGTCSLNHINSSFSHWDCCLLSQLVHSFSLPRASRLSLRGPHSAYRTEAPPGAENRRIGRSPDRLLGKLPHNPPTSSDFFFFSCAFSALSSELNRLPSPPENSGVLFACVPHPEPTLGDGP